MTINLTSQLREITGRAVKSLRDQGLIPAVIYGHGSKVQNLTLMAKEFEKVFSQAGESTLIDLAINEQKSIKVLIQDLQRDAVSDTIIHVDFHQVKMDEKITAEVPLKFSGEARAVKELGGVFVQVSDAVKIECLPGDLISEIIVDVTNLSTFTDKIQIKDLAVPAGVKILAEAEETVALVEAPRTEKEVEDLAAAPVVLTTEAEVVGKEKAAEEAAATTEGAKPAKPAESAKK